MIIKVDADIPLAEFMELAEKHDCDLVIDRENKRLNIVSKSNRNSRFIDNKREEKAAKILDKCGL